MHTELKQNGALLDKIKSLPKHVPRQCCGQCKDQYSPSLVLKLQKYKVVQKITPYHTKHWPPRHTRNSYTDTLRAGRPGDGIPVGVRFISPVQTHPLAHPLAHPISNTMGHESLPGDRDRGAAWTTHPFQRQS
jgi:hypothetical protein